MVTAVSQTGQSVTALGRANLASNFDTFLALLTTQMKNQDPLAPLDSNQFTQQLVQMSGVEQQLLTNDLLQRLVGASNTGVTGAVGLIGKEVRALSDTAAMNDGKVSWIYDLDAAASDLKVQVLDAKGAVVYAAAPADKGAGEHAFTWDGKTFDGAQLKDGVYTLQVTAKDSTDAQIASAVYVQGVATGVEQSDGATLLTVNGGLVSLSDIISVRSPVEAAKATTPTTPDTSG